MHSPHNDPAELPRRRDRREGSGLLTRSTFSPGAVRFLLAAAGYADMSMEEGAMTDPARGFLRSLDDLDYPANKQHVVAHAEAKGATSDVIAALRGLPLGMYANRDEIFRSIDIDVRESGPSTEAAQALDNARSRVAKSERDVDQPVE